jgi:integrase
MPVEKLTERAIERTTHAGYLWDVGFPGFGIRVQASGRKTFIFRCRPEGGRASNQRELRLGTYPTLSLDGARREARRLAGVVAAGNDPGASRDRRREDAMAKRSAPTVELAGADYLKHVARHQKPRTVEEYTRQWDRHILPALGSKLIADVRAKDIRALHRRMAETPVLANRVVALLGAFFTWAEAEELRASHSNPAIMGRKGIKPYPEHSRERFLSPEEYERLGAALRTAESTGLAPSETKRRKPGAAAKRKHVPKSLAPIPANPFAVAAIRFLALSGWREQEALTLRRDAVRDTVAMLADSKTGRSVRRLGAAARLLLNSLPRIEDSAYAFPGRDDGEPLKDIARLWTAVRDAAKLEDVTLHGLRHSFASVGANRGLAHELIGQLLGHTTKGSTTAKYVHYRDDVQQAAADAIAGEIAGYLGLPTEADAQAKSPTLQLVAG